jgi:hypothetical protein
MLDLEGAVTDSATKEGPSQELKVLGFLTASVGIGLCIVSPCPWRALTQGLRAGQHDPQAPNLSPFQGDESDAGHAPCTSPNAHDQGGGAGRLDQPYPGRRLTCLRCWHIFLLDYRFTQRTKTLRDEAFGSLSTKAWNHGPLPSGRSNG